MDVEEGVEYFGGSSSHHEAGSRSPKKLTEDASVKAARGRFKNVLKHMVQERVMQQEEESDSDTENAIGIAGSLGTQGGKNRKTNGEPVKAQPAFVMKLFDRGVDLAQFGDSSPLYPICRAWIQNKPHAPRPVPVDNDTDSNISDSEFREETEEVTRLPPPEPLPFDEYGDQISYRVPPPLPRSDEPFDINYDDQSAPSPALLFQEHLDRWNLIRRRWKEASAYNESRYGQSFSILRGIHERNRAEEANASREAMESAEKPVDDQSGLFIG